MKAYKAPIFNVVIFPLAFLVMLAIILRLTWPQLSKDIAEEPLEVWFFFACIGWVIYGAVCSANMAYEVRLHDDGSVEFRRLFGNFVARPSEISTIKAESAFIEVKSDHGKVQLPAGTTGFYEVVSALKALNPGIKVKGY